MSRLLVLFFSFFCFGSAIADNQHIASSPQLTNERSQVIYENKPNQKNYKLSPIWLGLDAEFSLQNSYSAQAIEMGMQLAIAEINANGGVLGGRPFALDTRDNASIPARGLKNLEEIATKPDLVAVFGGRFSPVIIEQLPLIEKHQIPFFVPWAAADPIVDNGMKPNYVFRVSLRDSLAMPFLIEQAKRRGYKKIGLMLVNTSWGRSNFNAAKKALANSQSSSLVGVAWHNSNATSLQDRYLSLLADGAEAIILVANDQDAAVLFQDIADLPASQRLPVFAHWGVTGGNFTKQVGKSLKDVEFYVVQTFSFYQADRQQLDKFQRILQATFRIDDARTIDAPTGVAHAYDSVHLLAKAIQQVKTTDRRAIRDALERLKPHRGLVKYYSPAFTPDRHEALDHSQLILVQYRQEGRLVPVSARLTPPLKPRALLKTVMRDE